MKLTKYEQTGEIPNVDSLRKKHGATAARKSTYALQPTGRGDDIPLRKKQHRPGRNKLPDDVVALMLKRYQDPDWPVKETAAAAGVTLQTVRRYAIQAGIPARKHTHKPSANSNYEAVWYSRKAGETYEQAAEKGNVSAVHARRVMRKQEAMTEEQRIIIWNTYRRKTGQPILPLPE